MVGISLSIFVWSVLAYKFLTVHYIYETVFGKISLISNENCFTKVFAYLQLQSDPQARQFGQGWNNIKRPATVQTTNMKYFNSAMTPWYLNN